jgi:membrane protease YdiL (CAAX protease family)
MLTATEWIIRISGYEPAEHSVFRLLMDPSTSPQMRCVAFFGALVLAPIGEELLFRGIIQSGLQKLLPARWGSLYHRWAAVALASALFAFLHLETPHFVPTLFAFGCLLGFLYERTGSLLAPILVHMLFNGRSLLWNTLTQ